MLYKIKIISNNITNAASPLIAYFKDGTSVAIWQQFTAESNITLVAQAYDADNLKIGDNTYIASSLVFGSTKLKAFQDGSYVVAYSTLTTAASNYKIYAQYFNSSYQNIAKPFYLMSSAFNNRGIFDIDVTTNSLIVATGTDKQTLTVKAFNKEGYQNYVAHLPVCMPALMTIEINVSPTEEYAALTWSARNNQGIFTQRYNVTDWSTIGTLRNIPSAPTFVKTAFLSSEYQMISWQESYEHNNAASFVQILDHQGDRYDACVQISGPYNDMSPCALSGVNGEESNTQLQAVQPLNEENYVAIFVTYSQ